MSWYKSWAIIIYLFLLTGCSGIFTNIQKNDHQNEDEMILHALEYKNKKDFNSSIILFKQLYETTRNKEYSKEVLLNLIASNNFVEAKLWMSNNQELLELFDNKSLGMIYEKLQDYESAFKYYEKQYNEKSDVASLLGMANIYYSKQNKKNDAIALLETGLNNNGFDMQVCMRLLQYFEDQKEFSKLLGLLAKIHNLYKTENDMMKAETISSAINSILNILDTQSAIAFLESNRGINDKFLITLYKKTNQHQKLIALTMELFNTTKDYTYLAQSAIFEYESTENKSEVLKSVSDKFEIVVQNIQNHEFLNFYGYLLIDHNINYSKGIELIKNALLQDKENLAYLDSLAWGYYKINNCADAKRTMQKVVNEAGLGDAEIKLHWDKIKDCKGKK